MKKKNELFIAWGIIVLIVVVLLTILGFMLKNKTGDYVELENKLLDSAKKYVDNQFLYPDEGDTIKVTSSELIEHEFLDELKLEDDSCEGYVSVYKDGVYKYKAYIKCNKYTTTGYEK